MSGKRTMDSSSGLRAPIVVDAPDIALQRATAELARRETHFRSLIEKSSDIITVMRSDGAIIYESSSVERFLGYTAEEMLGKNALEFLHPDDLPRALRLIESVLDNPGSMVVFDYKFRHKEGPWRYFESVCRNMLSDPAVAGIVINSRDITRRKLTEMELGRHREHLEQLVQERTAELASANLRLTEEIVERKRAETELKERAEQLSNFLAIAGHELRHPISVVKGYATMLHNRTDRIEPGMLAEILDALDISADRLTDYVKELVKASLVEQGKLSFEKRDIELAPLIDEAIRDLKAIGCGNDVSVKVARGAGRTHADPSKLKQLIDTLLNNAIKFSPDGSPVHIEARKDGDVTAVSVMDRGIGVPGDMRDAIFDRFFQVEDVRHHSSAGLGLGLYLARAIVTAHNGTIKCEARPGGGSIFTFTITPD